MFLIMFKTRQALPLPFGTFFCPRICRVVSAGQPRKVAGSWPQTRHFHERELIRNRALTETVHVHGQSITAFNPRLQTRRQSSRSRDSKTALTGREQGLALDKQHPQSVRVRKLSPGANLFRSAYFQVFGQATNCPRPRILVTNAPTVSFPVHISIDSSYAHF